MIMHNLVGSRPGYFAVIMLLVENGILGVATHLCCRHDRCMEGSAPK